MADAPTPVGIGPTGIAPDIATRIRTLLAQNQSLRAIQREIFGYTGGAAYEAVKAVQAEMEGTT